MLSLLHSDEDSSVRACLAYTLGQTNACWAIPVLIQALLDEDEHVAETALNALECLASPDNALVVHVIKELAYNYSPEEHASPRITHLAHQLLKKWRR